MPASASMEYRRIGGAGTGQRIVLREDAGDRTRLVVLGVICGATLPAALANPRLEARGGTAWRLTGDGGEFDFEARAADRIEMRPGLYRELHRPFALKAGDRLAARLLLALLRLPGGARLLRYWHARRSR